MNLNGFQSLRTRPIDPVRPEKRRCLLCGAVLRSGNEGVFCRPCLWPDMASLMQHIPEWAQQLVEGLSATDPQVRLVAGTCLDSLKIPWPGKPAELHQALRRKRGSLMVAAEALGVSRWVLTAQLTTSESVPLTTVLAINRAVGDMS